MSTNYDEIMANQPTINIGMIGSVSNGKSSLVERLTNTKTQRHASEKKSNKTVHLGYANCKIFKCVTCPPPQCYQSHASSVNLIQCNICQADTKLVKHVSFVDCPGHNMLMATMLNGTCVMDTTLLVESINSKQIPAPQTVEHLIAAQIMNLDNKIVCINKMDLIKQDSALKIIEQFKQFLNSNPVTKKSLIVPTVGNSGINKDVLCEYISRIPEPVRDLTGETKMIIIRSFNVNRCENKSVTNILGGVVGGTVMKGVLKVGDAVEILPGLANKIDSKWMYLPLVTQVRSVNTEGTKLQSAYPGGLIGVQLGIDPGITAKNGLVGNVIRVITANTANTSNNYHIYTEIHLYLDNLINVKINKHDTLTVNYNACNVNCTVSRIKTSKDDQGNESIKLQLSLDRPVCVQKDDYVTISKNTSITSTSSSSNTPHLALIGRGKVVGGLDAEKCTVEQFCSAR